MVDRLCTTLRNAVTVRSSLAVYALENASDRQLLKTHWDRRHRRSSDPYIVIAGDEGPIM